MADETRRLRGFGRGAAVGETAAVTAGEGAKAGIRGARRAATKRIVNKVPITAGNIGRLAAGPLGVGIQASIIPRSVARGELNQGLADTQKRGLRTPQGRQLLQRGAAEVARQRARMKRMKRFQKLMDKRGGFGRGR